MTYTKVKLGNDERIINICIEISLFSSQNVSCNPILDCNFKILIIWEIKYSILAGIIK